MTEYRIVEEHRRFSIQVSINGHDWRGLHDIPHVPRFFDSLADARSWVATIKRGVVYHDAEDAPNLAQDERKAEARLIGPIYDLGWFKRRIGSVVVLRDTHGNAMRRTLCDTHDSERAHASQFIPNLRYHDPR